MDKETKKLVKALEAEGYTFKACSSGHTQIFTPDGDFVSGLAGSPSEYRGWANTLSRIKRIGGHIYANGTLTPVED